MNFMYIFRVYTNFVLTLLMSLLLSMFPYIIGKKTYFYFNYINEILLSFKSIVGNVSCISWRENFNLT
jgi:hypothetical protein